MHPQKIGVSDHVVDNYFDNYVAYVNKLYTKLTILIFYTDDQCRFVDPENQAFSLICQILVQTQLDCITKNK